MIRLSNGHWFKYAAASGSLGFDGRGYWFEQPFRWLKLLQPQAFTIITKTLTLDPRVGNLRWYKPWQAVRFIRNGVVNNVSLTNPGIDYWMKYYYPIIRWKKYNIIVSIAPRDYIQATLIAEKLNHCTICGIEVNLSCPNIQLDNPVKIVKSVKDHSKHPIIVKLGFEQNYVGITQELASRIEAVDVINSVNWWLVNLSDSPLDKYGYSGAVSGSQIKQFAQKALSDIKQYTTVPVISGGGIDSLSEVQQRFDLGTNAVAFGTMFLQHPTWPNKIVNRLG